MKKDFNINKKVLQLLETYMNVHHDLYHVENDFNFFKWEKLGFMLDFLRRNEVWVNVNAYHGSGIEWDILDGTEYVYHPEFCTYPVTQYEKAWKDAIRKAFEIMNERHE